MSQNHKAEVFGVGAAGGVWATWRPPLANLVAGQVWHNRSSGAEPPEPGLGTFDSSML